MSEEQIAYKAGYDAGMNGSNIVNCGFRLFSTPDKTRAWERGKADGEKAKAIQLMEKRNRGQE